MSKKILYITLAIYAGFIIYANCRTHNPSKDLTPVHVQAFEVKGLDEKNAAEIESAFRQNDQVTGYSIKPADELVSVTYKYQEFPQNEIEKILSVGGSLAVVPKIFATQQSKCPVHKYLIVWEKLLDVHTF